MAGFASALVGSKAEFDKIRFKNGEMAFDPATGILHIARVTSPAISGLGAAVLQSSGYEADRFLELLDVKPNIPSFDTRALQAIRINAAEDGLESFDPADGGYTQVVSGGGTHTDIQNAINAIDALAIKRGRLVVKDGNFDGPGGIVVPATMESLTICGNGRIRKTSDPTKNLIESAAGFTGFLRIYDGIKLDLGDFANLNIAAFQSLATGTPLGQVLEDVEFAAGATSVSASYVRASIGTPNLRIIRPMMTASGSGLVAIATTVANIWLEGGTVRDVAQLLGQNNHILNVDFFDDVTMGATSLPSGTIRGGCIDGGIFTIRKRAFVRASDIQFVNAARAVINGAARGSFNNNTINVPTAVAAIHLLQAGGTDITLEEFSVAFNLIRSPSSGVHGILVDGINKASLHRNDLFTGGALSDAIKLQAGGGFNATDCNISYNVARNYGLAGGREADVSQNRNRWSHNDFKDGNGSTLILAGPESESRDNRLD